MSLAGMIQATNEVASRFDQTNWTPEVWALDLNEEVGELCNAILVRQGYKHVKRGKADLADSLCDILFDLLMLSATFHIDLEAEYQKMLQHLEKRIDGKEFSD